jgi:hypothetical protein
LCTHLRDTTQILFQPAYSLILNTESG